MRSYGLTFLILFPLIMYVSVQADVNQNPHARRFKPLHHGRLQTPSTSIPTIAVSQTTVVTTTQAGIDVNITPLVDIETLIDADIEVLDETDSEPPTLYSTQAPVDVSQTPLDDNTQSPIVAYIQSSVDATTETSPGPVENTTIQQSKDATTLIEGETSQLQQFSVPQEITQLDVDSQSSIAPTIQIDVVADSQPPVAAADLEPVNTSSSLLPPIQLPESEHKAVTKPEVELITHLETSPTPKPAINHHHSRKRKPKISSVTIAKSKLKSARVKSQHGVLQTLSPEIPKSSTQQITTASTILLKSTASKQKHRHSQLDSVCEQGDGYYAVKNQCDSYIKCEYNQATKLWCPDGLHFNPAVEPSAYPCAYPSEVKCIDGIERDPSPTDQCPRQYGIFPMNDGDCSKYVICQKGTATIMPCPTGLVFNPTLENCDYLEKVPQCNPNVFKDFTCPVPPIVDDNFVFDVVNTYKYKPDCKLYIACQKGYPRLLSCERGLAYDEESESCIAEENVADCETPYAEQ